MPVEEFLERVVRRTGLDGQQALRTAEAVLEMLGERISGGQADDGADQLARDLYQPLMVGKIRGGAAARPPSLDEFVNAIAEREGVTRDQARARAGAVLQTLREAVSDREFAHTLAQLPGDSRCSRRRGRATTLRPAELWHQRDVFEQPRDDQRTHAPEDQVDAYQQPDRPGG